MGEAEGLERMTEDWASVCIVKGSSRKAGVFGQGKYYPLQCAFQEGSGGKMQGHLKA